jgi:hypothetical protein
MKVKYPKKLMIVRIAFENRIDCDQPIQKVYLENKSQWTFEILNNSIFVPYDQMVFLHTPFF